MIIEAIIIAVGLVCVGIGLTSIGRAIDHLTLYHYIGNDFEIEFEKAHLPLHNDRIHIKTKGR